MKKKLNKTKNSNQLSPTETKIKSSLDDLLESMQSKKVEINKSLATPLSQIFLPLDLNKFFEPHISNISDIIQFIKSYTQQKDEYSKKIIEAYENFKLENKNKQIDLNEICLKSNISTGDFRRYIIIIIDLMSDDLTKMLIGLYKPKILETMIRVAVDESHPDSMIQRKLLGEALGLLNPAKGVSPVTIINSQTINEDNRAINLGLPKFNIAESLKKDEEVMNVALKELTDSNEKEENKLDWSKGEFAEAEFVEAVDGNIGDLKEKAKVL